MVQEPQGHRHRHVRPHSGGHADRRRDRVLFERELMRQGIGVVFRTNESGRIYGATFIDHATRPFSTVPVWARSFQQVYLTSFLPGRTPPPEWHHNSTSRNIPTPLTGRSSARTTAPTTRTAPPETWLPPSTFCPRTRCASGDHPVPPQRKKRKKRKYGRQQ